MVAEGFKLKSCTRHKVSLSLSTEVDLLLLIWFNTPITFVGHHHISMNSIDILLRIV